MAKDVMSEPKPQIAGIETPDAEVELSAQDLLELSAPVSSERAQAPPLAIPTTTVVPGAPALQKRAAPNAAGRNMSSSQVAASVIFAVGTVGALYYAVVSYEARQSAAIAKEQPTQSQLQASAPKGEGKPVRFANPFDPKEVFEFPAGTSEAEARDAVAEMLMERAMERQRRFDARVSSNR
jgi:hypothetical protein